jgi:hypothetical protein
LDGQRKADIHAAPGHERSGSGSTHHSASVCPGPDRDIAVTDDSRPSVVEQTVEVAELEGVESPRLGSGIGWERVLRLEDEEDEAFERAMNEPGGMSADVSSCQHYDSGHLAGTSRHKFDARQDDRQETKSRQEKTEEEIVLEYVKKQSLVEEQHRSKGKGRVVTTVDEEDDDDDDDDEDLRRALELSMQGFDCA